MSIVEIIFGDVKGFVLGSLCRHGRMSAPWEARPGRPVDLSVDDDRVRNKTGPACFCGPGCVSPSSLSPGVGERGVQSPERRVHGRVSGTGGRGETCDGPYPSTRPSIQSHPPSSTDDGVPSHPRLSPTLRSSGLTLRPELRRSSLETCTRPRSSPFRVYTFCRVLCTPFVSHLLCL